MGVIMILNDTLHLFGFETEKKAHKANIFTFDSNILLATYHIRMDVSGSRGPPPGQKKPQVSQEQILRQLTQRQQHKPALQSPPRTQQTETQTQTQGQPKQSSKSKRSKRSKLPKNEGFKIVIRLLPPNLKEDALWQKLKLTTDLPSNSPVISKYFVQGKYSSKPFKTPVYSRAYIQFKNGTAAERFVQSFRNVVFEDEKESMVPTFMQSLYPRMPEPETKPKTEPKGEDTTQDPAKSSLANIPAFKLFMKFYNGEIDRPEKFLTKSKEILVKEEKLKKNKSVDIARTERSPAKIKAETDTKSKRKQKNSGDKKSDTKISTPGKKSTDQKSSQKKASSEKKPDSRGRDKKLEKKPSDKASTDGKASEKKPSKKSDKKSDKKSEKKTEKKPEKTPEPKPSRPQKKPVANSPSPSEGRSSPSVDNKRSKETTPNDTATPKPKPKMILKRPQVL
jgi:regulator of nonsense transcripts 3